jgi:hypothetical protein
MATENLAKFKSLSAATQPGQGSKTGALTKRLSELSDRAAAERRTDYTRLALAVSIMLVYLVSVAVALAWLGSRIPDFRPESAAPATLDPYSLAVLDILKVLVLPVVTLMLGFYFGTGSSHRSGK